MKHLHLSILFLFLANAILAQSFTALSNSPVNTTPGDSRSINVVDLNGDGLEDLYITNGLSGGQNNEVYINWGNGLFVPLEDDPMVSDNSPSDGATCADADNDGDLDCFMVTWYNKRNYFYENLGDTTFGLISAAVTGTTGTYSETTAFGDYNNDGLVDLYLTNSEGDARNMLYKNNGANQFVKISAAWLNEAKPSRGAAWADYDNDGDLDLYVANESNNTNSLFRNEGNEQFVKLSGDPAVQESQSSMTASWGDVNNDGLLDLFVGNAGYFQAQTNRLFLNNGNGGFEAAPVGPINTDASCTYGSAFADYDNDGDLDLFVSNGFCNSPVNYLYQNDGTGLFARDQTALPDFSTPCSFGAAWGDLDNNGFQDLVVSTCKNTNAAPQPNNMVWMNNGNNNHWLKIKLVGTVSNRAAIGAQVRLWANINGQSVLQMREISAQTGYCGQNSLIAHFGLGNATQVDSLHIAWPSGSQQAFHQIGTDVQIQIEENNATIQAHEPVVSTFQVALSPNPVNTDELRFQITGTVRLSPVQMYIFDTLGRQIQAQSLNNLEPGVSNQVWPIPQLVPGVYFLAIQTADGANVVRFLKR